MAALLLILVLLQAPSLPALLTGSRPQSPIGVTLLRAEGKAAGKSTPRQRWPVERFFKTALFFRRRGKSSVLSPLLRSLGLEEKESPTLPLLR